MGVLITLQPSISNFLSSSLQYLDWCTNIPDLVCLICNPKKKFSFPIIDISNSPCMTLENSLHSDSLVDPKMISSTYICTRSVSLPMCFIKRVVSTFPFINLGHTKSYLVYHTKP